ncbi:recombination regulator RecX [Staphylococcus chromogenes]|nr:recombination regulator RecX [Staphylococcus chromogenes]
MTKYSSKEEKLQRLAQALEEYSAGEHAPLFDRELEQRKATIRNRALGLLDHRARSEHELTQRLIAAEFEPELVTAVVTDLKSCGLVDDEAFAREWVRQRHHRRGKSKKALDVELKEKGIASGVRQLALAAIDEDTEQEKAHELAVKKARSIKQVPADFSERQKALARIVGMLARRGYPQHIAMPAAISALDLRISELQED